MSLERIGLGGVFEFNSASAIKAIKAARREFTQLMQSSDKTGPSLKRFGMNMDNIAAKAARIKGGIAQLGSGMRNLAFSAAPASLALFGGGKKAADFEHQMSAVGAVTNASAEDMAKLTDAAKKMGITSAFSATESGQALENLGRAGANANQAIASLSGVTNLAAADGIDLATSADINAKIVKGMGMEWANAGHVADVLAEASANANTDVRGLGESFTYGVSAASNLNMGVEETAAIFGKLADSGLKGSMGGTAFTNMMTKLSKPTGKATKLLKQWKVSLEEDGKLRRVSSIVDDISKKMAGIKSPTERAAIAQELFGQRGARAYGALATAGKESIDELQEKLEKSSEGEGAAARMATKRLDNLKGQLTLLGSSLEGAAIEFFGPMLAPMKDVVKGITEGINQILMAFQDLGRVEEGSMDIGDVTKKYKSNILAIAMGVKDAIKWIRGAFDSVVEKIEEFKNKFKDSVGGDSLRKITKFAAIFLVVAGVLAPVLLGLMGLQFVIGAIISVVSGLAAIFSAAFLPVIVIFGILYIAYQSLKQENESLLETVTRVFGDIKAWALDVWENGIYPFYSGLMETIIPAFYSFGEVAVEIWNYISEIFSEMWDSIFGGLSESSTSWKDWGKTIGNIFAFVGHMALAAVKVIAWAFKHFVAPVITVIGQLVMGVIRAFGAMFDGNILEGFHRLGAAIIDFLFVPLRWVLKGIINLIELIPGAEDLVPKGFKDFLKGGFTELAYGGSTGGDSAKPKPTISKTAKKTKEEGDSFLSSLTDMFSKKDQGLTPEAMAEAVAKGTEKGQKDKKVNVSTDTRVCVDGENVAHAMSSHQTTTKERSGEKFTPWQRKQILEQGMVPVGQG